MEKHSERIQEYIDGQLGGDELRSFEARLAVDVELRSMVALQREVYAILCNDHAFHAPKVRMSLKEVNEQYRMADASPTFNKRKWLPLALLLFVGIMGSLFFFHTNEDLYALPAMRSVIVREPIREVSYKDAVAAYTKKSYAEASHILERLLAKQPEQMQYNYYLGLSYMGQERWSDAISRLQAVAESSTWFADDAKYYLAVIYISKEERSNARLLLDDISPNSKVGVKAKRLLHTLK